MFVRLQLHPFSSHLQRESGEWSGVEWLLLLVCCSCLLAVADFKKVLDRYKGGTARTERREQRGKNKKKEKEKKKKQIPTRLVGNWSVVEATALLFVFFLAFFFFFVFAFGSSDHLHRSVLTGTESQACKQARICLVI